MKNAQERLTNKCIGSHKNPAIHEETDIFKEMETQVNLANDVSIPIKFFYDNPVLLQEVNSVNNKKDNGTSEELEKLKKLNFERFSNKVMHLLGVIKPDQKQFPISKKYWAKTRALLEILSIVDYIDYHHPTFKINLPKIKSFLEIDEHWQSELKNLQLLISGEVVKPNNLPRSNISPLNCLTPEKKKLPLIPHVSETKALPERRWPINSQKRADKIYNHTLFMPKLTVIHEDVASFTNSTTPIIEKFEDIILDPMDSYSNAYFELLALSSAQIFGISLIALGIAALLVAVVGTCGLLGVPLLAGLGTVGSSILVAGGVAGLIAEGLGTAYFAISNVIIDADKQDYLVQFNNGLQAINIF